MATIKLTNEILKDTIEKNDIVLIDFWATWCGPCRAFKPIFEAAAEAHPDITFASCDTEDQRELASAFGIRSIPTLAVFRDGVLLYKQAGMLPKEALEDLVGQVRKLDMDAVRNGIASQQAGVAAAG